MNFNKAIALFLSTALAAQTLFAGQDAVVSAIGKNQYQAKIDAGFKLNLLKVPYFFTVPEAAYGKLSSDITSQRTSSEKMPLVLTQFNKIDQEKDKSGQSDLGLRLIIASASDKRENVSHKLAKSGLVKTGDIILSARPALAGTIPYIHVQLGVTHAGMALVKTDADGKEYVINVDMPLNAEMLGDNRMSKFTSAHYAEAGVMFHILRDNKMTDEQRENVAQWLEMFRSRSKEIYKVKSKPDANEKYADKITFNMDYMNPSYDATKSGDDEMRFVADLGRLALGKSVPEGLTMYCSEFAWAVLSLKNCNPSEDSSRFKGDNTPSCVQKVFEPMPVFGSLYEAQHDKNDFQFGMSDGPILLADIAKADPRPNKSGKSVRQEWLQGSIIGSAGKNQASISQGHRDVEAALLNGNPDFYQHVLGYYALTAVPNAPGFEQQIGQRNYIRQAFNAGNRVNYSPTAFFMHAMVPNQLMGREMTQKSMDYISTLYFMPASAKVQMGGQSVDAYQALVNAAKATK